MSQIERAENSAANKLSGLKSELTQVLSSHRGKNASWENLVLSKINVLETAIQTILSYGDLPEGMTLQSLEVSVRELISNKPELHEV